MLPRPLASTGIEARSPLAAAALAEAAAGAELATGEIAAVVEGVGWVLVHAAAKKR